MTAAHTKDLIMPDTQVFAITLTAEAVVTPAAEKKEDDR